MVQVAVGQVNDNRSGAFPLTLRQDPVQIRGLRGQRPGIDQQNLLGGADDAGIGGEKIGLPQIRIDFRLPDSEARETPFRPKIFTRSGG